MDKQQQVLALAKQYMANRDSYSPEQQAKIEASLQKAMWALSSKEVTWWFQDSTWRNNVEYSDWTVEQAAAIWWYQDEDWSARIVQPVQPAQPAQQANRQIKKDPKKSPIQLVVEWLNNMTDKLNEWKKMPDIDTQAMKDVNDKYINNKRIVL